MPNQNAVLHWSAYEHEHVERGSDWYLAHGIVAVSIAVTSILFHDVLFAILILVAAATIALQSRQAPDITNFEISERGIRINGTLHRYREIIAFWVEDEHPHHRPLLLVDTTKILAPNLIIPIEHVDPREIRAYLKEHAEERHMKEPLPHKILEFLGL